MLPKSLFIYFYALFLVFISYSLINIKLYLQSILYYIRRIYLKLCYLNYSLNIPSVIYLVLSYLHTAYNNVNNYWLLLIDIGLPIIHMLIIQSIECNKRNICVLFCKGLDNL